MLYMAAPVRADGFQEEEGVRKEKSGEWMEMSREWAAAEGARFKAR
jgi:hypothetical protein